MGDFGCNIHACFKRLPSHTNHVRIGAPGRGAADGLFALIQSVIYGRITSKVETMARAVGELEHPEGTRQSIKAYGLTATGAPYRMLVRNVREDTLGASDDFAALVLGLAGPAGGVGIIAGEPLLHPGTMQPFVGCNAFKHFMG
jgi:hypothetical protein